MIWNFGSVVIFHNVYKNTVGDGGEGEIINHSQTANGAPVNSTIKLSK